MAIDTFMTEREQQRCTSAGISPQEYLRAKLTREARQRGESADRAAHYGRLYADLIVGRDVWGRGSRI